VTYAAVHQVTNLENGTRYFENRHGIKIVITQEGQLGKFTLVNFMFFMGGAVATLALASIVVDNLVVRFFIPGKVKEIIDLASATTVPVRDDLNQYLKAVEREMGTYEAPVTFWEVEREWLDHQEQQGKLTPRPNFKKTAALQLQKLVESAREDRMEKGGGDQKTDTELVGEGALAFARSVSGTEPPPGPDLTRTMSSMVRERWKIAKEGVWKQVGEEQARMSMTASSPTTLTRNLATPAEFTTGGYPGSSTAVEMTTTGRRTTVERQPEQTNGRRATLERQPEDGRRATLEHQPEDGRRATLEHQPEDGRRATVERQPHQTDGYQSLLGD